MGYPSGCPIAFVHDMEGWPMRNDNGVIQQYDINTDSTKPASAAATTLAEQHALLAAALASIAPDIAE